MKNLKNLIAILLILSVIGLILTGCGDNKKNMELDMSKINENLTNLKGEKFDIFTAEANITLSGIKNFEVLGVVYDFEFKALGINSENLEGYRFNMDKTSKDMWVVFLPIEGQKDTVKTEMDSYIQKLISNETDEAIKMKLQNFSYEEIDNYLIWVVSEDNDKILEITRAAKADILPMMLEITTSNIKSKLGLDSSLVEEFVIKEPAMITNASTYIVVKPAKDKYAEVKLALDNYIKKLDNYWSNRLPEEYELVKNYMYKEYEGYLIYIISTNNDAIYNTIINSTK